MVLGPISALRLEEETKEKKRRVITHQRMSSAIAPSPWTPAASSRSAVACLQYGSFKDNAPIYSLGCWRTREGGGSRV